MGRPLAKISVLAACIAFAILGLPGVALAQQPALSAVAGQPFTGTGRAADYLDGTCTNVRDMTIQWRDGSVSGATSFATVDDAIDIGGTPIPIKWVDVTGTHTFALPGAYNVTVTYTATCENASHEPYDAFETNVPLFNVNVQSGAGSGTNPPTSCPLGQTTSLVQISQASCGYNTYYGSDEKWLFRKLAKAYYHGYVVDKTIDGVVSFPGTVVSQGFFGENAAADLVIGKFWGDYLERLVAGKGAGGLFGKGIAWGWILNAPKYASKLDYYKYAALTRLADDPPDPNFTALASPPKLPRLRGAPRQVGERDRREAALYIALLTTVERAGGAQQAGSTTAESRQIRHASGIASQLVRVLGEKQKALKAAARVVKRIPAGRLPRSVVRRAKRRLDPRSLTPSLRKLGFTRDEIAEVRQAAPSVPLKSLTAPFQKVLGLGAEARTVGAERAALAKFAKRHAAGR
jgi:hypothetical protein